MFFAFLGGWCTELGVPTCANPIQVKIQLDEIKEKTICLRWMDVFMTYVFLIFV